MYKSIVLSGQIATGTTTTAKSLSQKLHLSYHSAGDFFRQYAIDHNIPLHDKAQIQDDLDQKVDRELSALADKGGVVIDAHYLGYFTRNIPHVLKVLLTCDYQTRIKRALDRTHTHTETEQDIKLREEGLDKKFRKLYAGVNFLDPKFFNLVIDTTNTKPEDVVKEIMEQFSSSSS